MDWIRENKSLATIVGIFLAGVLALGVVLFMANSGYSESLEKMSSMSGKVAMLEKASVYPSEANLDTFGEKVSAYQDSVGTLSDVLIKLQPPVKDINDTDFVANLKTRVAKVREKAAAASIKLPKDFAFGFDEYTKALPPTPEAARQLNDYFETVDAVVTAALDAGIVSLDALQRSSIAVEKPNAQPSAAPAPAPKKKTKPLPSKKGKSKGQPAKPPKEIAQVVERRQLSMSFTTDQKAFQALTNALASPSKMPYFTVVRVVRVENEKQEGPLRNGLTPLKPEEPPPPPPQPKGDGSAPVPQGPEVIVAPKAAAPDATAVMGKEMLKVFFDIDLVRFRSAQPE